MTSVAAVELNDFRFFNNGWAEINDPNDLFSDGSPKWIQDTQGSNRRYLNNTPTFQRITSLLLIPGTLFLSGLENIGEGAIKIAKVMTFANFWMHREVTPHPTSHFTLVNWKFKDIPEIFKRFSFVRFHEPYHFKARCLDVVNDVNFVFKLLPSIGGRIAAACLGILSPRDGVKLYATFERWQDAHFRLAPCLQPHAQEHGLGGNIDERDVL